jgi:hypothetical protein
MANFGVGLGSFVDSFAKGYGIRSDIDDRKDRKAREERDNAWEDKARARTEEIWGRQDKQYGRDETQRSNIEKINTDARQTFDEKVKAGTAQPEEFDSFYTGYVLPKMKNELLLQGNVAGAQKLMEWGETADAKEGSRLSLSAMLKAQNGDPTGALDDVMRAGKLKGYIDHGYEISGKDVIKDTAGNVLGYRLKMKSADGKDIQQDIRSEDLPNLIATFANPEAAWKSQQAAAAAKAKKAEDLETYKAKKDIDQAYGIKGGEVREKAITALRKRLDGGIAGDEPTFDSMKSEEKEKLISDEISLQTGDTAPGPGTQVEKPQRKVIVDTVTGRVIDPKDAATEQVSRKAATAAEKVQATPEYKAKEEGQRQVQMRIDMAANRLNLGEDPRKIAADLQESGVPTDKWPEELKTALTAK